MSHTPEERLFGSIQSIIGSYSVVSQEELDKVAEEEHETEVETTVEVEQPQEEIEHVKISSMSVDAIMNDPNFLRGVSDRVAARGHEIEAALQRSLTN